MPYNNGIVNRPLNTADVSKAIGKGSLDVGTLCSSTSINKWAKCKPFRYGTWGFATQEAALAAAGSDAVNWGFGTLSTLPTSRNITAFRANCNLEWPYLKPEGSAASPFRLLDFDGYVTTAKMKEILGEFAHNDKSLHAPMGVQVSVRNTTMTPLDSVNFGVQKADDIYKLIYLNDISSTLLSYKFGLIFLNLDSSKDSLYYISSYTAADLLDNFKSTSALGNLSIEHMRYDIYPVLCSGAPTIGLDMWGTGFPQNSSNNLDVITIDGSHFGPVLTTRSAAKVVTVNVDSLIVSASKTSASVVIYNNLDSAITIDTFFAYMISEGVVDNEVSDYDAIIGIVSSYGSGGSAPTVDYKNSANKILGRLVAIDGTSIKNTRIASGKSLAFNVKVDYTADGLNYPYNEWTTIIGGIGFIPEGSTLQRTTF